MPQTPVFDPNQPFEEVPVFDPSQPFEEAASEPRPEWKDIGQNYVKGVDKLVGGVAGFAQHPIDTTVNAVKGLASGVATAAQHPGAVTDAVMDAIKEKYGSVEALRNSFIKDPVGVTTELGPLVAGAPGAVRLLAKGGVKLAETAGIKSMEDLKALPGAMRNNPSRVAAVGDLTESAVAPADRLTTAAPAAKITDDILYQKLMDMGWTPQRVTDELKKLGPNATLADIEPFAGTAEASAQFPKGAARAKRELGGRAEGAEGRLLQSVDANLSDENFYQSMDYQRAVRSNKAQPLRREALEGAAGKTIKSDVIQRLQKDSPWFNGAMAEGRNIAKEEAAREGIEIPQTETWFHGESLNDPNLVIKHEPTLRMLDAVKQGYQEMLRPYRNQFTGVIDKANPKAVELSKTVDELTDILRQHSSKYGEYLDTWSEHSQQLDALARGRKILEHDPEVTQQVIRNATPNERLDMQTGLARAIKDKVRDNPQAVVRLLKKGKTQDKIRALFKDDNAFDQFHQDVLREAKFQETANKNLAGSQTSARREGVADLTQEATAGLPEAAAHAAGLAADVKTMNAPSLYRKAVRFLTRNAEQKAAQKTKDVADQASQVLHTRDPVEAARAVQRFRARTMTPKPYRGIEDIDPLATDDLQ